MNDSDGIFSWFQSYEWTTMVVFITQVINGSLMALILRLLKYDRKSKLQLESMRHGVNDLNETRTQFSFV